MSQPESTHNKVAVITGASSGIGLVTARELAGAGYEVVIISRESEHADAARATVAAAATGPAPVQYFADLASQAQIRDVAARIRRSHEHIDVLINNAGASFSAREQTEDGIERTFAVNHLAPFLLTRLLLDLVVRADAGRIVMVSSETHSRRLDFANLQGEKRYNFFAAYTRSKLENVLFAYELARRLDGTRATVNALSPGPARSRFGDNMSGFPLRFSKAMKRTPLFKSPEQAARTSVWLATSPDVEGVTGKFFMHSKERRSKRITHDPAVAARLWTVSEELTGLAGATEEIDAAA
ncbi:MAG: SDR family NAD(P)-dependent oxidoreductase [Candidatus Dormibacteraeota bacterium]|nr:SDR family NAD(P)-dependent oxidoreductase [Candidatus Dormibacteraeota bacterium]MBV9526542.1 SDR family NAD(P)-dependent oxidoreductase [Candidatus Dormibacteraeota bacterium]